MNDKERMEELVKILDKANNDYYVLDAPTMRIMNMISLW